MKNQVNFLTCLRKLNTEVVSVGSTRAFPGLREFAGTPCPLCLKENMPFTPRSGKPEFFLSEVHLGVWFCCYSSPLAFLFPFI